MSLLIRGCKELLTSSTITSLTMPQSFYHLSIRLSMRQLLTSILNSLQPRPKLTILRRIRMWLTWSLFPKLWWVSRSKHSHTDVMSLGRITWTSSTKITWCLSRSKFMQIRHSLLKKLGTKVSWWKEDTWRHGNSLKSSLRESYLESKI